MTEIMPFLDLLRVISLLIVVICQIIIAYSMWVFSRHQVVAFGTSQLALVLGTSACVLTIVLVLTVIKLALTG